MAHTFAALGFDDSFLLLHKVKQKDGPPKDAGIRGPLNLGTGCLKEPNEFCRYD